MSSNPKYQVLKNEDDDESNVTQVAPLTPQTEPESTTLPELSENISEGSTETPVVVSIDENPPPYDGGGATASSVDYDNDEPPPLYTEVVKLPTYNESENINDEEEEQDPTTRSMFFFWLSGRNNNPGEVSDDQVGSHVGFIFGFLVSFIFNWIGFLISYCMTNDLSSHYGAISGFGLSLVKWGFLMKHSSWSKEYLDDNPWFFYFFVLFGWVVFLRGVVAYAQLNRLTRRARIEAGGDHLM